MTPLSAKAAGGGDRVHAPMVRDRRRKLKAHGRATRRAQTRRVALTPAGEALLERSRALLDGVADAVQLARDAALGRTGRLRVGLLATGSLDLTPVALRAFAADVPGAQISVHDVRFDDPSGGVRDGDTDIADAFAIAACAAAPRRNPAPTPTPARRRA